MSYNKEYRICNGHVFITKENNTKIERRASNNIEEILKLENMCYYIEQEMFREFDFKMNLDGKIIEYSKVARKINWPTITSLAIYNAYLNDFNLFNTIDKLINPSFILLLIIAISIEVNSIVSKYRNISHLNRVSVSLDYLKELREKLTSLKEAAIPYIGGESKTIYINIKENKSEVLNDLDIKIDEQIKEAEGKTFIKIN